VFAVPLPVPWLDHANDGRLVALNLTELLQERAKVATLPTRSQASGLT